MATLPVHPVLAEELRGRETAFPWMFPDSRGRAHGTPTTISIWVSHVAEAAGIGHVQTHQLRHATGSVPCSPADRVPGPYTWPKFGKGSTSSVCLSCVEAAA